MTQNRIISVLVDIKALIMCGYSIKDIAEKLSLPYATVHRLVRSRSDIEALYDRRAKGKVHHA